MEFAGLTLIIYGVAFLSAVMVLLRVAGFDPPRRLFRACVWAAGPLLLAKAYLFSLSPANLIDFEAFWQAGVETLAGRDPYHSFGASTRLTMLNPPTAIPLVAAFGALPMAWANRVYVILYIAGMLVLVELCRRALNAQAVGEGEPIPTEVGAGLAAAVALSNSSLVGLHVGQMHLLAALALVAALLAQGRGRPVWAGLALAVATIKPQTMMPFLLLFTRRSDHYTWLALFVGVGVLCLAATSPLELPGRIQEEFALIGRFGSPGQVNDYSYANQFRNAIVGPEALLYDLGLRERRVIRLAGYALVVLLGAGLARAFAGPRRVPRGAACALVGCYSMLFLYHRVYDSVILALPLVYAVAGSLRGRGAARVLYAASVIFILLVLNMSQRIGDLILARSWSLGPVRPLVRATLVPYATWAVLAALACLWAATRMEVAMGPRKAMTSETCSPAA